MVMRQRFLSTIVLASAVAVYAACNSGSDPVRPARIEAVAGAVPQSAIAGSAVPVPPAVHVTDSKGGNMANVTVVFSVTAGGGSVIPATVATDANGIATTTGWILGPTLGTNRLNATATGLPPVIFTAEGVAGAPASVTAVPGTTPQTGVVGSDLVPPAVVIRDAAGNPNAGILVTFATSAGTVSPAFPASVTTDANGRAAATRWTLGTHAGTQIVNANAGTLPIVQFVATALPGPAAVIQLSPASLSLSVNDTRQINASLTDAYSNPLPGSALQFTSLNTSVATVTSAGLVSAVGAGSTTINVSAGSITRSVPITVFRRIGGLSGRPFGVRVLSGNIAYVTRQDVSLVTRFDASTLQTGVSAPTGNDPADIVFDAAGAYGYTPNVLGGSVSIVKLADHTLAQLVPVTGSPFRIVMSPDGGTVYVSGNDGKVALLETASRTIIGTFNLSGPLNGMSISADGTILYVSSMSGDIFRVNAGTGQVLTSRNAGGVGQEVVLSPHSTGTPSDIYVANEAGWVDVLDATTLAQKQRVSAPGAFGMAMSPNGAQLWVSAPQAGKVYVFRRSDMALINTHDVGGMPRRIAFTADGKALIANEYNWVDVLLP
jgi:WD40 repeat protein